ncbi:DUF6880 family protein [Brevundimonas sp. PAMC22021]|uniref:DUF6880 family protein n=1 Tax=Brevundimonas sp. PAMC22021 TaxID=2861285 RepID=UPI001C630A96|nr:DUF6880 family protein [Brevundimonas sp. PAMC22021]QYF85938.1 hypothetical protein KY493_08645 [Brevundimonas sp. PAMC22021]
MAKRPSTARKTVSAENLAGLGAERLAALLLEAASADANLKRRMRMELAAEVGPADLALEIDKRLNALATSKTRVSWRKRPALLSDLKALRRIIVERLAGLDARLGLDRLVAWFDLYPRLSARLSDAKGELPLLFEAATADLVSVANAAGVDVAAPVFVEALSMRLTSWASWIGQAAQDLEPELARRLIVELMENRPPPTGRLALVLRRLANRIGDLDAWIQTYSPEDLHKPEVTTEMARRLGLAGRAEEGRAALEASRIAGMQSPLRQGRASSAPAVETWLAAEIAVLEAENRQEEAREARWRLFERTLSADTLRALLAGLPDFDDVVALDRAFEAAAAHSDAMKALAFLMNWPALREAGALIVARADELRGAHENVPLWASRLAARQPQAALLLLRARARALVNLGVGLAEEEVAGLIAEAEALASGLDSEATDHQSFLGELRGLAAAGGRRIRR